jgi:hypothetical protein
MTLNFDRLNVLAMIAYLISNAIKKAGFPPLFLKLTDKKCHFCQKLSLYQNFHHGFLSDGPAFAPVNWPVTLSFRLPFVG